MKTKTDNQEISAFLHLLARFREEDASIYNAMAPGYDRFASSWEHDFAREALDHLMRSLAARTKPGGRVLDAGCGTGLRVPELIDWLTPGEVVGVDLAEPMLDQARRKHYGGDVSFRHGNLLALPFEDESFDVAVATWTLETMLNPGRAVSELLRVIRPDGVVAYSFVQIPQDNEAHADALRSKEEVSAELSAALAPENLPFHACPSSELQTFADGWIATVILRKCCEVTPRHLPNPFDEDLF